MKKIIFGIILSHIFVLQAQDIFNGVYPIGDKPDIGFKNSLRSDKESILFEANPILRMSLYNNILTRMMDDKPSAFAWYIAFRPQIRMYIDTSLPVKMPSYKISILGYQHLWRFNVNRAIVKAHILAISYESGHYSNGQSNCAFHEDFKDGSQDCINFYNTLNNETNLSDILNRNSGNFSTNFTEISIKNRSIFEFDSDLTPKSWLGYKLGFDIYHDKLLYLFNVGGYSDEDITIYGRARINASVEFMSNINKCGFDRYLIELKTGYITNPHKSVNQWRTELITNIYLEGENSFGFFVSGAYGHDNYNYRFVDSGFQVYAGINFDIFSRIQF